MTMLVGVGARAILGAGRRGGQRGRQPRHAAAGRGARRRRGDRRRRPLPGDHQRRRLRDDPRGRRRPRDRRLGRRRARRVDRRDPRKGEVDEHDEVRVARIASIGLGVVAIVVSILAGEIQRLDPRRPRVRGGGEREPAGAAMALFWPRFNTTGAVAGVLGGLLVVADRDRLSPPVWPGPDGRARRSRSPTRRSSRSRRASCACWLGTMLSRERAPASYHELHVRAETGIGAV